MECIYKNISLDVHDDIASQLSISVKQGDTSRGIRVALTDHGKVFRIPDDCYAVFSARKSTGNFISGGCIIQNNTIIYNYSESVVSVATQLDCELTVYSSKGDKITSPSFTIFVYQTIQNEFASGVVESDSFATLNNLISDAVETIAEANTAIKQANSATEAAVSATEEARNTVTYIRKTSDGKLEILDADHNLIETIDVCYMDNDTIYRYENGVLSVRGIKDINSDETFRMWIGTTEECMALTQKDEHTFYWITDDATFDEVIAAINAQNETLAEFETALKDGSLKPKKAEIADTVAGEEGHMDKERHIWFSDSTKEAKRAYSDHITYNPSTDILKVGYVNGRTKVATNADNATNVIAEEGTAANPRHVWFSDNSAETKRAYSDKFKYNPSTDTLKVGRVTGTSDKADLLVINSADIAENTNEVSISATGLYVLELGVEGSADRVSIVMMISDLSKSVKASSSASVSYSVNSGSGNAEIECKFNASSKKINAVLSNSSTSVFPYFIGIYRIGG